MIKKLVCIGVLLAMLFSFGACSKPQKRGEFYKLQEAYDLGYLTVDDLKNIAYHFNGSSPDESFVPTPKNPETLSAKTEKAIKETSAYDYRNWTVGSIKDAKPNGFTVVRYLGTYNNCVAVLIVSKYEQYTAALWEEKIEGVTIKYNYGNRIYIFKAN